MQLQHFFLSVVNRLKLPGVNIIQLQSFHLVTFARTWFFLKLDCCKFVAIIFLPMCFAPTVECSFCKPTRLESFFALVYILYVKAPFYTRFMWNWPLPSPTLFNCRVVNFPCVIISRIITSCYARALTLILRALKGVSKFKIFWGNFERNINLRTCTVG